MESISSTVQEILAISIYEINALMLNKVVATDKIINIFVVKLISNGNFLIKTISPIQILIKLTLVITVVLFIGFKLKDCVIID